MDLGEFLLGLFGTGTGLGILQFIRDRRKNSIETDSILVVGADKALDTMRDALDVANRQRDEAVSREAVAWEEVRKERRANDALREELADAKNQLAEVKEKLRDAQASLAALSVKLDRLESSVPSSDGS